MENEIYQLLTDGVAIVGTLGALTFLLPAQYAKYFNIIGKIASVIKYGLEALEKTNGGLSFKRSKKV